jgi:hypothetical protein
MLATSERLLFMAQQHRPQQAKSLTDALALCLNNEDEMKKKLCEAPTTIAYVLGAPNTWTHLKCGKCNTKVQGVSGQESYCINQGQGCRNEFALKENKRSFEIQVCLKSDDNADAMDQDQDSNFYALLLDDAVFQLLGMGASQFAELAKDNPNRATNMLTSKFAKIRQAVLTVQVNDDSEDFTVVIHHFAV